MDDVREIVAGLTKQQKAVILALNEQAAVLGCSAQCADRLTRATSKRPALVTAEGRGFCRYHWLNADGYGATITISGARQLG